MNVSGPSRLRGPRPVPGSREKDSYEDLTRTIAQLGLSDVERLQSLYDHKERRAKGPSDREVAIVLLMQNARELAQFNADLALAQRLAVDGDEEPDPTVRPATAVALQRDIERTRSNMQTWSQLLDSFLLTPVSSGQTTPTPGQAPTITARCPHRRATGHICVICHDPIFGEEVLAPCNHFFDISCIIDLFRSAMRDERLFPPRCCHQNIPLPQVRPHLTQAFLTEFELKAQEYGTLKRVYCVESTCSRFLGPLHDGGSSKIFTCPSPTCMTMTCGKCRGRYKRFTHSCTPDAETEVVLTLSRASGWSRCPGCAQMIELSVGCFHMSCRCKTEFCYLCRALWKTCKCPRWDESRLLARAQ